MQAPHSNGSRRKQTVAEILLKAPQATTLAGDPFAQKCGKNGEATQPVSQAKNAKNRQNGKALLWEPVNSATWRLVDPNGTKIETPRSHGHWPGFLTPKPLAWVFDVGVNKPDWRVRIRERGGWRALGSIGDLDLAKRLAQTAAEGAAP
jgi:hypothetical protein